MSFKDRLEQDGYFLARAVIPLEDCELLCRAIDGLDRLHRAGERRILERLPEARRVATTGRLASLIREVLGADAFALRATLFDKTAAANWRVGWHQDQIIEVAARVEAPGYQGWSVKDGAAHVQPPSEVLEGMVAARIHLDDTLEDNGPLDVSPGSHRHGKIPEGEEARHLERGMITVTAGRGDVLVMKPLILHRSRAADRPVRRRVLHVEYAAADLSCGVDWGARYAVLAAASSA